jgi:hypothetical protein
MRCVPYVPEHDAQKDKCYRNRLDEEPSNVLRPWFLAHVPVSELNGDILSKIARAKRAEA